MCVGVCLLGYLFVCLCGIRACMNEWMSDVRKWSMSIAHSSNSSSVWFAWPSIKQYPHRHLLSHTHKERELKRTHAHAWIHPKTHNQHHTWFMLSLCFVRPLFFTLSVFEIRFCGTGHTTITTISRWWYKLQLPILCVWCPSSNSCSNVTHDIFWPRVKDTHVIYVCISPRRRVFLCPFCRTELSMADWKSRQRKRPVPKKREKKKCENQIEIKRLRMWLFDVWNGKRRRDPMTKSPWIGEAQGIDHTPGPILNLELREMWYNI